ncbi:MAG: peptidoglycan editing factor PgeF [Saprospiraceae bacterium]|nr:peptidoglycan editing factor PgeF [Saprospiraceae bacterium]
MIYRLSKLLSAFPEVLAAESTRHGGVSPAPYESLNLGLHTNDAPQHVRENRRRFFAALGISEDTISGGHQVHGDQVFVATAPGLQEGYDAFITQKKGLFVTVGIADCTPVLIYDTGQQAVAAVHAGWKGTALGIVRKTLEAMHTKFGTQAADCYAWVGTCIDECSYEVGVEVARHFDAAFKTQLEGSEKFTLDLKAANKALLLQWGIPESQIEVSPYSTVLNPEDYFSHRREHGLTGRMMAVIGIREPEK